ncbi:MAG: pyridoxal-phosphate dependent enzyme, partial [Dongiaceae bacterium]
MTNVKPTFTGVEAAAQRLREHLTPTPLVPCAPLSRALDADLWFKVETATPIASFKLRGALNHLLVAKTQNALTAAVTSSTGNHGQGVAYAARLLGVPAEIFLPDGSAAIKQAMIRLF